MCALERITRENRPSGTVRERGSVRRPAQVPRSVLNAAHYPRRDTRTWINDRYTRDIQEATRRLHAGLLRLTGQSIADVQLWIVRPELLARKVSAKPSTWPPGRNATARPAAPIEMLDGDAVAASSRDGRWTAVERDA